MGRDLVIEPGAFEQIAHAGQDLLSDLAGKVVTRAKSTAPVLTGQYRDGIEVDRTGNPDTVHVGSTSGHAIYVEARTGNLIRALGAAE